MVQHSCSGGAEFHDRDGEIVARPPRLRVMRDSSIGRGMRVSLCLIRNHSGGRQPHHHRSSTRNNAAIMERVGVFIARVLLSWKQFVMGSVMCTVRCRRGFRAGCLPQSTTALHRGRRSNPASETKKKAAQNSNRARLRQSHRRLHKILVVRNAARSKFSPSRQKISNHTSPPVTHSNSVSHASNPGTVLPPIPACEAPCVPRLVPQRSMRSY